VAVQFIDAAPEPREHLDFGLAGSRRPEHGTLAEAERA